MYSTAPQKNVLKSGPTSQQTTNPQGNAQGSSTPQQQASANLLQAGVSQAVVRTQNLTTKEIEEQLASLVNEKTGGLSSVEQTGVFLQLLLKQPIELETRPMFLTIILSTPSATILEK